MRESEAIAQDCAITYRQLDYWTRAGWLHPVHGGGSGRDRQWPDGELAVARMMGVLVKAGLRPDVACGVARTGRADQVLALLDVTQ